MSKNLLPNASLELPLGQGLPNNWADLLNPLTLNLAAMDQYPKVPAELVDAPDAPEGQHVAQVAFEPDAPAHLTSPAVAIERGRVYVVSVYARSDTPSVKLCLSLWTRPMDWRQQPDDAPSDLMPLTEKWQRYEFTFTVGMHAQMTVVDFQVTGDAAGHAWLDAAQLETGPVATDYEARFAVESALSAQDKRFNGALHLLGDPVTVDVDLYNATNQPCRDELELVIHDIDGRMVASKSLDEPVPPGRSHQKVAVDLGLVGDFRANCRLRKGPVTDVGDYSFTVHPVIGENEQRILVSVDGKARPLPAERSTLPWTNRRDWYAEPAQELTVTNDGSIYVFAVDGAILRTTDGGRSWQSYDAGPGICGTPAMTDQIEDDSLRSAPDDILRGSMCTIGVMSDGMFFNTVSDQARDRLWINRSNDQGRSWQPVSSISTLGGGTQRGQVTELADGTLILMVAYSVREEYPCLIKAYLSTDHARTWTGYPVAPGGEPFVRQLQSGRLLAVLRHSVSAGAEHVDLYLQSDKYRQPWQRASGNLKLSNYKKNLILVDSDDSGKTWHNAREATCGFDEMHGMAVDLPDERVVLFYVHRVPRAYGGERAKISRDGGNTWAPELYHLNTTPARPGYSASCVLPAHLADGKPGMILTIIGQRAMEDHPAKMSAVRWRPLG